MAYILFLLLQSDQISLGDAAGGGNTLSVNGNGNRAQYHLFFVCEVCGSSHSSKWERWLHINNTHNNESSIKVSLRNERKLILSRCFIYYSNFVRIIVLV